MFYQLLEQQTSHSYTLVEDVKVTPELAKIIANLWRDKGLQAAFRYVQPLLTISGFVLDEKLQRNASKFAIFMEYWNKKTQIVFFVFHFELT